jgi:hypothetical protein
MIPPLRQRPAAWRERGEPAEQQQQQQPPAAAAPAAAAPPKPPPPASQQQQQQLLEATAKHLLELNQKRADAEARAAELLRKNHELSERLADLEKKADAEARKAADAVARLSQQQQEQQQPKQAEAPPKPAPAAFTIEYHNASWPKAFLHYCCASAGGGGGGKWTRPPGVEMRRAADGAFVVEVGGEGEEEGHPPLPEDADALEFAFNDGGDGWDNGGGSNFRAAGRGAAWRVRGGRLERVK